MRSPSPISLITASFVLALTLSTPANAVTISNGVATYSNNETIGNGFVVPDSWTEIVIAPNTTLSGNFVVPQHRNTDLSIYGMDRTTSRITGLGNHQTHHNGASAFDYSAVFSKTTQATVYIDTLTSENPDFYHLLGRGRMIVDNVSLISDTSHYEKDGFDAQQNSSITNSFISTNDDGIKLYHDNLTIANVIIEQKRNGSPLQLGWDSYSAHSTATISNLQIIGTDPENRYNSSPIAWISNSNQYGSKTLSIDNITIDNDGEKWNGGGWEPIGTFDIRPWGTDFNLTASNADINVPTFGKNNANGNIQICETGDHTCARVPEPSSALLIALAAALSLFHRSRKPSLIF